MTKTTLSLAIGISAFTTLFVPTASAGCGKGLISNRAVVLADATNSSTFPTRAQAVTQSLSAGAVFLPGPVGMWLSTVSVGGQPIFQSFESFTSDGLEFLNDNGAPQAGNVCFGVWSETAENTYQVYHPSWNYDDSGNVIGTVIIRQTFQVNPDRNSYKGTVTVDTFDLNGKVAAPQLQADVSGTRITVN